MSIKTGSQGRGSFRVIQPCSKEKSRTFHCLESRLLNTNSGVVGCAELARDAQTPLHEHHKKSTPWTGRPVGTLLLQLWREDDVRVPVTGLG